MTPDPAPPADPTDAARPPTDFDRRLAEAADAVATRWLRHLIDPDQVVELRALRVHDGKGKDAGGGSGSIWAGTFRGDELHELARAALAYSGHCQGVYYTLNPLRPSRFVRQAPRMRRAGFNELAHDADVLERRWLLVDIDPVKPAAHKHDSATDAEKAATLDLAMEVRAYLTAEGCGLPVVSDSGNGHHLLYRLLEPLPVDPKKLPVGDDDPVRLVLHHLADKWAGDGRGTIDTAVFNPGRIVKFPGTLSCKGSGEGDRPHRRAMVVEVPTG